MAAKISLDTYHLFDLNRYTYLVSILLNNKTFDHSAKIFSRLNARKIQKHFSLLNIII